MTDTLTEVSAETADLRYVAPGALVPNPLNPRVDVVGAGDSAKKKFQQLVDSIAEHGVLEPVLAFERDNIDGTLGTELVLLAGHRRQAAAVKARAAKVPVLVRPEPAPAEQRILMLIENGHRNDLAPIEEARAYVALVEDGVAQKDIAHLLSRSEAHVSKRLAIVQKLPDAVLKRFEKGAEKGGLSIEVAYALTRIADDQEMVERLASQPSLNDKWVIDEVDRELARRDGQKRRTSALAELEAASIPVFESPQLSNRTVAALCGNDADARPYGYVDFLALEVESHKELPCHGAIVGPTGAIFWVCAEPASHTGIATSRTWGNDVPTVAEILEEAADAAASDTPSSTGAYTPREVDPEARARFEAAQARAVERRAFLADLLSGPLDAVDHWPVVVFAAWNVSEFELYADSDQAGDLLGADTKALAYDDEREAFITAIFDETEKVAFAAALSAIEPLVFRYSLTSDSVPPSDRFGGGYVETAAVIAVLDGYLQWLDTVGFASGDVEAHELAFHIDKLAEEKAADDAAEPSQADAVHDAAAAIVGDEVEAAGEPEDVEA